MKYRFTPCESCGQMPIVADTGLCGPCCFGEADSMYDWVWEDWHGNRRAGWYAFHLLQEAREYGMRYEPDLEKRLKQLAKEGKKNASKK